jgi:Uma2 family endonuclease
MAVAAIQLLREPRVRRWTLEEYYTMAETGLFAGQHVELIDGEIIEMSPQGDAHVEAVSRAIRVLPNVFGLAYWLQTHAPLRLGGDMEPEPDATVLRGTPDYPSDPLQAVVLVVEISDSSLTYDRTRKAGYYSRAGIADYWIVNLIDRQLEIHRDPVPDPVQPEGFRYAKVTMLAENDSATPLVLPEARIAVRDLLPREDVG